MVDQEESGNNQEEILGLSSQERDSIAQAISAGMAHLKEALEEKNWQAMADYLNLPSINVNGHPEATATVVENLTKMSQDMVDLEAVILQVYRSEIESERARFSLCVRLIWNDADNWEEKEKDLDLSIGFQRTGDTWAPTHLSLSETPEHESIQEEDEAEEEQAAPYFAMPEDFVSAPYFAEPADVSDQHHLVYIPVIMHESVVKKLLGKG